MFDNNVLVVLLYLDVIVLVLIQVSIQERIQVVMKLPLIMLLKEKKHVKE